MVHEGAKSLLVYLSGGGIGDALQCDAILFQLEYDIGSVM